MKNFETAVLDFLKANISDKVRKVAADCEMNPDLLYKWLRDQRSPTLKTLGPVMDYLGAKIDLPDGELVDYDLIPKVAAVAGAGASLLTDGTEEGLYAFRKDFIAGQNISPKNSVLMSVMGDSMTPLLYDGDTILIDKSDTEIMDGKIYVVTLGEELRVKRIMRGVRGLFLHSENPAYPDIPVASEDLSSFVVHGRVRWCGKLL